MTVQVVDIAWRRSILLVNYRAPVGEELVLVCPDTRHVVAFEDACDNSACSGQGPAADDADGVAADDAAAEGAERTVALNLMLVGGRVPLDAGRWVFAVREAAGSAATAQGSTGAGDAALIVSSATRISFAPALLARIDSCSRIFSYRKRYAYTAFLRPMLDDDNRLFLAMDVAFFMENPAPVKAESKTARGKKEAVFRLVYRLFARLARKNGKRILFLKVNGTAPTDNMAALQRRIRERGLDGEFEIACRCRNLYDGRQDLKAWLADLWAIAKADYIFLDDYCPVFNVVDLDASTVLTQLWHAGVGFKSVGYARFGLDGSPVPYACPHRKYTYAIVGSAGLRPIYSEVFGIEEEALLACGMPRLDHFLDADVIEGAKARLEQAYPFLAEGRTVLFAPTYRGTGQKGAYYPYDCLDLDRLYEACEKTDSHFIFKMHHFIKESAFDALQVPDAYKDRIHDLSGESINELFYETDLLVTDYSSCFYDYLLLERPIVFFVPDRVDYEAAHGVQRPLEEMAPGTLCDTFDQLASALEKDTLAAPDLGLTPKDRAVEKDMMPSDRIIDTVLLGRDVPGVRA